MRKILAGLMFYATVAQAQPDLGKTKLGDALGTQPGTASSPPSAPVSATGVGNLPPDFYPKSPCVTPDAASIGNKPGDARDVKAVDAYNKRIQAYNDTVHAYNGCVTDYAARAQVDLARIQAAVRNANAH